MRLRLRVKLNDQPAIAVNKASNERPRTVSESMKIAHLITRLIVGGAQENTLLTVKDQLHEYGDSVTLISGPAIGPEGSLEDQARDSGVDLRIIPQLRRSIHPWRDWQSYREILYLLQDLRPEILHTHSSKAGIIGRAAAARLGIPVVHTIHGAAFHTGQHPIVHRAYVAAERWAGRRTDHFISVCDAMTRHYLAKQIGSADKYTTIYSGMNVEPFLKPPRPPAEVRLELGLQPDDIVVGKVARLFHLKGHEFVLAAAPSIVRQNPRVKFLLVGDGSLRGKIEAEIQQMNLADHFVLTGLVPPSRIPELIHAMDIVVHTSQWEGLARVLPQGLIAGKPVVSFDVDGAREVVQTNETGHLLGEQTSDAVAAAVLDLANDSQKRTRLGQTGRERLTEQFRHETMTCQIRDIYACVLGKSPSVTRIAHTGGNL